MNACICDYVCMIHTYMCVYMSICIYINSYIYKYYQEKVPLIQFLDAITKKLINIIIEYLFYMLMVSKLANTYFERDVDMDLCSSTSIISYFKKLHYHNINVMMFT
jgi:hypothetical protein